MRVADLVAPLELDRFDRETFGRRPLHIPAAEGGDRGRAPIGWAEMNALLGLRSHWTEANLKLVMNSRPILPDLYLDAVATLGGTVRRADPAKVDLFLAMGASLVANALEEVSPKVRTIADALAAHYGAHVGANAYCSFEAVQAFASHCDLHEVFAVQCEGEKVWRIYENRAEAPVAPLEGDGAQALIDRVKGKLLMEARMRPGDLLYIPRGYYHDALATEAASLHVSFSLLPLTGRILFRLLEEMAVEDAGFRAYLPDARREEGGPLTERLAELGKRIEALLGSDRFRAELARRQRALVRTGTDFRLPERRALDFYARTDGQAEVEAGPNGAVVTCGGTRLEAGALGAAAEWMLARRGFALQELFACHPADEEAALRALAAAFERAGLIRAYQPAME
jgi:cupin superfamily protein